MNWDINILNIVSAVVILMAVGIATWAFARNQWSMRHRFLIERELLERQLYLRAIERDAPERDKSEQKTLAEIVEEKKKKFQNITGISFHFVDEGEVTNFYNDTFKEPTVQSLVAEIATQVTGEVKAGLPQVLESKLGGKDLSKWISTIKLPDTSLPGMFARYQRAAIKRGEVVLGLEELDIELNELQQFEAAVNNLHKSFGLTLDQGLVDTHMAKLKQRAAETMLGKLENATGWVLIEGRFKIDKVDGRMYRCTYSHPVNEYFPKEASPVTMSFTIRTDSIETRYAGNYAQSSGRLIPLRVYGKVWQPIDRHTGTWDLEITPLAIY